MQARRIFSYGLDVACGFSMSMTLLTGSAVAFAIAPGTNIVFALAVYQTLAGPNEEISLEVLGAAYEYGLSNALTGFFATSLATAVTLPAVRNHVGFFQQPQVAMINQAEENDPSMWMDRPIFQN